MKSIKLIKILFVWLTLVSQAIASNPNELKKWVDQGNELYKNEKYEEAISAYNKALDANYQSADVYFNLGNANYKLRQIAPAIYNFEKALLLSPNDAEIKTNLKYAQQMSIDDINEVPKVGFSQMIKSFVSVMHYDTWAWLSVISFFVMLVSFIAYYFGTSINQKRLFFILIFVFLFFGFVSVISGFKNKSIIDNEIYAIVFSDVVSVNSEPKTNADEAFELHEGTKVFILESNSTWSKIQIANGKQGWILDKDIKKLK